MGEREAVQVATRRGRLLQRLVGRCSSARGEAFMQGGEESLSETNRTEPMVVIHIGRFLQSGEEHLANGSFGGLTERLPEGKRLKRELGQVLTGRGYRKSKRVELTRREKERVASRGDRRKVLKEAVQKVCLHRIQVGVLFGRTGSHGAFSLR
jgi:hypothetical protein